MAKKRTEVYGVDLLAEERSWVSPHYYCQNNPIIRIIPDGMLDDGYQDLEGNYKWYDNETDDIIYRDDNIWTKVADDQATFDYVSTGALDNLPEQRDPGVIKQADNLTSFEMWLDSPSESMGESIGKIGANIGYSIINSPSILLTGRSLGGTDAIPQEKMDAFVDVVPGLFSVGLTKTAQVVKTTKNGLKGFNQFVKKAPGVTTTKGLPPGMNWQKRAGQLFQTNKVDQKALKDLDKARNVLNVGNTTKKELEK